MCRSHTWRTGRPAQRSLPDLAIERRRTAPAQPTAQPRRTRPELRNFSPHPDPSAVTWPNTAPPQLAEAGAQARPHAPAASGDDLAGHCLNWGYMRWQVLGSNQRRLSRRFYWEPHPAPEPPLTCNDASRYPPSALLNHHSTTTTRSPPCPAGRHRTRARPAPRTDSVGHAKRKRSWCPDSRAATDRRVSAPLARPARTADQMPIPLVLRALAHNRHRGVSGKAVESLPLATLRCQGWPTWR